MPPKPRVYLRARQDLGAFRDGLASSLERRGFQVEKRDLSRLSDGGRFSGKSIVLDLSVPANLLEAYLWSRRTSDSHRALVVLEPFVSAPILSTPWFRRRFSVVFAASPVWAIELSAIQIPWPYKPPLELFQTDPFGGHSEKALDSAAASIQDVSLVLASKRSVVRGEQYSLRRRLLRKLEESSIPVAVAGDYWDSSTLEKALQGATATVKTLLVGAPAQLGCAWDSLRWKPQIYLGRVSSKLEAFSRARVTLIVENSDDYVSEKLIDAIAFGVVPLVVGSDPGRFGVPAAVHLYAESPADAVRVMKSVTESAIQEIRISGQDWLRAPEGPFDWERRAFQVICDTLEAMPPL